MKIIDIHVFSVYDHRGNRVDRTVGDHCNVLEFEGLKDARGVERSFGGTSDQVWDWARDHDFIVSHCILHVDIDAVRMVGHSLEAVA